MYLVSFVPGLSSLAMLVPRKGWSGQSAVLKTVGVWLLLSASIWLFRRIYFLSSIVLTEERLEQSVLSSNSGVQSAHSASMGPKVGASFSGFSFHFWEKTVTNWN
jgi:hypothetical protein